MILPLQVELQGMESIHGSLFYIGTVSDWRATEMAGWGRTLAAKPDNLSPIPKIHTEKEENQLLKIVLWPPQLFCGTHVTHTHNNEEITFLN